MGMFDSLFATMRCPATKAELEVEIQFKFGEPSLKEYRIGGQLDVGPYGNLWIPEAYICNRCSRYTPAGASDDSPTVGRNIKDLVLHSVFIHLVQGRFLEVLTEEEFRKKHVREGMPALPEGQMMWIPYTRYGSPLFGDEADTPLFDR